MDRGFVCVRACVRVCVCVCVCVCLCRCVYIYIYRYIRLYMSMHTNLDRCMYVYIRVPASMPVRMFIPMKGPHPPGYAGLPPLTVRAPFTD